MLASSYISQAPQYHQSTYVPSIPSPLSPRSANIYRRTGPVYMTDEPTKQQQQRPDRLAYSKRDIKKAPVASQDALKDKRRGMFLRKVREGRDDKRFEARGEDIMRMDFMQRQRQWESEQARSAPLLPSDPPEEDEDVDVPMSSNTTRISQPRASQYSMPEEEADEVAQREREELEALLSYLPSEEEVMAQLPEQQKYVQNKAYAQGESQEHFGSDDDDYDALFSDLMQAESQTATSGDEQQHVQPTNDGDEMDMS